ncbi:MAG: DUF2079 domain-containing protein [Nannocystaceae bacterium]
MSAASIVEQWFRRFTAHARRWAALTVLICLCPGWALWPLRWPQWSGHLQDNALSLPDRYEVASYVAVTFGLMLAVYVAHAWRGRAHRPEHTIGASNRELNRKLLPLLAAPVLSWLARDTVGAQHPVLTLLAITSVAGLAAAALYRSPLARIQWEPIAASRTIAWLALVAAASAYAATTMRLGFLHHRNLATAAYDLGIYDQIFWQSSHGNPLGVSFLEGESHALFHFDPLLVLLSPLYLLWPRAEFLIALQAVWLASGAIPVFLLARRLLRAQWSGVVFAFVYLLQPALHGIGMYEFHSLALAGPLILLALYCIEARRWRAYVPTLALLLLVREDMALLSFAIAVYCAYGRKGTRVALFTALIAIAYFAVVKGYIMSSGRVLGDTTLARQGYIRFYADVVPDADLGPPGLLLTLFTNPAFVLQYVLAEAKVLYLAKLLVPLMMLPLLARRTWILYVYGLLFLLLASRGPVFSIHFQYSTVLEPMLVFGCVLALARLRRGLPGWAPALDRRRLVIAAQAGLLVAAALSSWKYGALIHNTSFRAGFRAVNREPSPTAQQRYAWVAEMATAIPRGATVSATSRLLPHVSNRDWVGFFPHQPKANYLFVNEAKLKKRGRAVLNKRRREGYHTISRHGKLLLLRQPDP